MCVLCARFQPRLRKPDIIKVVCAVQTLMKDESLFLGGDEWGDICVVFDVSVDRPVKQCEGHHFVAIWNTAIIGLGIELHPSKCALIITAGNKARKHGTYNIYISMTLESQIPIYIFINDTLVNEPKQYLNSIY